VEIFNKKLKKDVKGFIKFYVAIIFYYSGIFFLMRSINNAIGKRLTIVTYHRVCNKKVDQITDSLPYLFITEDTFKNHLKFYKKFYNILSFKDLNNYQNDRQLPRNSLVITFDDGYEDNFTRAFPILKKNGVPCTILLATDKIGSTEISWWDELFFRLTQLQKLKNQEDIQWHEKGLSDILNRFKADPAILFLDLNSWEKRRIKKLVMAVKTACNPSNKLLLEPNRFLKWEQVAEMKDSVNFGSHSCSHISLNTLNNKQIRFEVVQSKSEIEHRLGKKVLTFSYPAGHYTKEIKHIVSESGYQYALTQDRGINNLKDKFSLKRINIWEGTSSQVNGKYSSANFALALGCPLAER